LRILVDRLWPRGLAKSKLKLDAWPKHLSPSKRLAQMYQHDPESSPNSQALSGRTQGRRRRLDELRASVKGQTVTLLTATKELDLSHATVLRDLLGSPCESK